ncbi:unnamed protein product [Mucor hiemalis]
MEQQSKIASDRLYQFKKTYGKNDLENVRQISFAYGALLIEIVRRKEYAKVLMKNSNLLADVLAGYRLDEEKRRDKFRREVTKLLPFQLLGFDRASPQSEITLNGMSSSELDKTVLDKNDVTEFISLLETVYFQSTPHATSSARRTSSFLASSTSASSPTHRRTSSGSPGKITGSRFTVGRNNSTDENLLAFLNTMFKQMTDMRLDFLKTIETNFFTANTIDPSRIKEVLEKDDEPRSTKPPVMMNKPRSPKITEESFINRSSPPIRQQLLQKSPLSRSNSTDSSTFSVVEDDKILIAATIAENNELKSKLEALREDTSVGKQIQTKQELEITELRETVKNLEREKEDFEAHIQNLDHLVDTERQTFEQNRQSFLNELKNKDKSADFRIASAEEDYQSKINDLQYAIEEERRMKKNLEIEHASELNTLQIEHTSEIEKLRSLLAQEKQKTQDAYNENWESKHRMEQLEENLASVKYKLETERMDYEENLGQLQAEIDDKTKATDEIKLLQQQMKTMVKRAQDDWESKNTELNDMKVEQEAVESEIKDLLYRFRQETSSGELNLKTDIRNFRESLEEFTKRYDEIQYNFEAVSQELADLSEAYKNVIEVNNEWRSIASHMAERLEEFRKNIVYELILKLQLPMDPNDLSTLSRNLTPSDDDTAIWSQTLQLSSAISTQKFVLSVLEHIKHQHEHSHTYKLQYKNLKDKYRKIASSASEKISFRNFKVGDVALFLPTRNSTGKPWAAFNIGAPHYFLQGTDNILSDMESREWIVARIVTLEEHIVAEGMANPYGLAADLKYYELTVENWRLNRHQGGKSKKRLVEPPQDSGLASLGSPSSVIPPLRRPSLNSTISSTNNIVHSYAK